MSEVVNEVQKILGTRSDHHKYYVERVHRRDIMAENTDELWKAQPRLFPEATPTLNASDIVKEFGSLVQPFGRLPIPRFLEPCWVVRTGRQNNHFYSLFVWCDAHKMWDFHCMGSQLPEEIIRGKNIEDCSSHHDGHDITERIFHGCYNFGAAPDAIQKIFQRYNRERCRTAPPEHLRKIQVIQDFKEVAA